AGRALRRTSGRVGVRQRACQRSILADRPDDRPALQAWPRRYRVEAQGLSAYRSGRLPSQRRMSLENPFWGATKIHGELLRLGIQVAQSTVSIYMVPRPDRPLQTWKTFVRNHMEGIASIDLFVVSTIAFQQLFAFLVLGHARRRLLWFAVTRNPT